MFFICICSKCERHAGFLDKPSTSAACKPEKIFL